MVDPVDVDLNLNMNPTDDVVVDGGGAIRRLVEVNVKVKVGSAELPS